MTHICVGKLTIIGSDNSLSTCLHQAIIGTNAGILLSRTFETNFSEILSNIHTFHSRKWVWKRRLWNGGHFVTGLIVIDQVHLIKAQLRTHFYIDLSLGIKSQRILWAKHLVLKTERLWIIRSILWLLICKRRMKERYYICGYTNTYMSLGSHCSGYHLGNLLCSQVSAT